MRVCTASLTVVTALWGALPAAAQQQTINAGSAPPKTLSLVEDLRILTILNALAPSPEQAKQLAELSVIARSGLAAIDADVRVQLEQQREPLLAARNALLHGQGPSGRVESLITSSAQAAESLRLQRTEALLSSLSERLRTLLTSEQAVRIEMELAPNANQPWRRYVAEGSAVTVSGEGRLPNDPGRWVKDLRELRAASSKMPVETVVEGFVKKVTRGLRANSSQLEQSANRARSVALEALSMSPLQFGKREWTLAAMIAKQDLQARNEQRQLEGRAPEIFDPARWLVEQVLRSSRAPSALGDRAKLP